MLLFIIKTEKWGNVYLISLNKKIHIQFLLVGLSWSNAITI